MNANIQWTPERRKAAQVRCGQPTLTPLPDRQDLSFALMEMDRLNEHIRVLEMQRDSIDAERRKVVEECMALRVEAARFRAEAERWRREHDALLESLPDDD